LGSQLRYRSLAEKNRINSNHDEQAAQVIPKMTRNSDYKDLQHQFRGIVASIRASGFREVKSTNALAVNYTNSLKPLFLSARARLRVDQYGSFVSWVSSQEIALLGDILSLPKGYEQLSGVADSKPVNLVTEIHWATAVLERHIEAIRPFRKVSDEICKLVLSDEFGLAIEKLDTIDQTWGVSLWSLQLRVALTNEAYGLEAQKKVVADARTEFKQGLLGFVAYYCGVRNESRTTAERFNLTTGRRIAEHRYFSNEVKAFLQHQLLGDFPSTHSGMADILRVSQSHHFLDLYEDLISVLQALCFKPTADVLSAAVESFLEKFSAVGDFRIDKLRYALLDEGFDQLQPEENPILNSVMRAAPLRALRDFVNSSTKVSEPNPWDAIYMGWATSEGRLKQPKEKRVVRRCVRFIAATFMQTDLFDPHDAITKLSRNFGQLPYFRSLRRYTNLINRHSFSDDIDHRTIGLNSPIFGVEDLGSNDLRKLIGDRASGGQFGCSATDLWIAYADQKHTEKDCLGIVELARSVGSSLRRELLNPSEPTFLEEGRDTLGARNFFRDFVMLQSAMDQYQRGVVLTLIATACSAAVYSPLRHKVLEATKGYTWEHYQQCGDPILRSVAIRMVWEQCIDARLLSILRFSVKKVFVGSAFDTPSKLDWEKIDTPHAAKVFFLNVVCTTDVLDILKGLRGTRQVLEERAEICVVLQKIDPKNDRYYASELAEIQEQLSFADGQLIVDSSRIYVETPQLRQWAKTNLSEDYSRFRDLAVLDKENSQPFDELLAEIRRGQRDASAPFVAESEADVLLYSILLRLRDEFLTNAAFGLDFFLSKRIRHQSFIGSIRAPLELEGLITNRSDEESKYKPNYHWVNRLAVSSVRHLT